MYLAPRAPVPLADITVGREVHVDALILHHLAVESSRVELKACMGGESPMQIGKLCSGRVCSWIG